MWMLGEPRTRRQVRVECVCVNIRFNLTLIFSTDEQRNNKTTESAVTFDVPDFFFGCETGAGREPAGD